MLQHRLLDIAIREFSLKGLEGASTREIAQAAGTVMSSITYHYGGKEGLYLAAADHIAERMAVDMIDDLGDIEGEGELAPAAARAAIHRIVAHFVDKMVGELSAAWALFIAREQMNPTEAFERIYGGLMGRMLERLADLICIASGQRDEQAARIATFTLIGQVTALRSSRATCLKLLRRGDFDADSITAIKARIAANLDAILDTPTAERQEPQ